MSKEPQPLRTEGGRQATIRQHGIIRLEGSREVGREIEHYNSLPVSQRIIQDHGGAIRVVSSLERGTEFVITLPRKARP